MTYLILHERFYSPSRYSEVTRGLDSRGDVERFGPFSEQSSEVRQLRLLPR